MTVLLGEGHTIINSTVLLYEPRKQEFEERKNE